MYDRAVHQLDLCMLAYHLYAQALRWPMDPFSEEMARPGTHRRELFLARIRRQFADQRTPDHLDPILTDLERIGPIRPALFKPESNGKWSVFATPPAIVDRIGAIHLSRTRTRAPELLWAQEHGPDVLFCFEGVTGGRRKRTGHSSLLGHVLVRALDDAADGDYELHVTFRGARSGWVMRSAARGLLGLRGNPDWTTAMDRGLESEHPLVTGVGRSSRGFARAMAASLPAIVRCLDAIDRSHPPIRIEIAGHSLGGALATNFAAAMAVRAEETGPLAADATGDWRTWPWDNIHLTTYGTPTVGDHAFRERLEGLVTGDRYLIRGDPVTAGRFERWGVHVGRDHELEPPKGYDKRRRWRRSPVNRAFHEPALIRRSVIQEALDAGRSLLGVPAASGDPDPAEPWQDFDSLAAVLRDHPHFAGTADALRDALPMLAPEVAAYLRLAAETLRRRRAYPMLLRRRAGRRRTVAAVERLRAAVEQAAKDPTRPVPTAKAWADAALDLDDDALHDFFGLCLALVHLTGDPQLRPEDLADLADSLQPDESTPPTPAQA